MAVKAGDPAKITELKAGIKAWRMPSIRTGQPTAVFRLLAQQPGLVPVMPMPRDCGRWRWVFTQAGQQRALPDSL